MLLRYYIGQAGYGRANDKGRLHLGDANFCMGGPGVIFSRSMMQGLCPHIDECMNDKLTLTTGEEDVEIGRCIYKKLNLQCTSAYEVSWSGTLLFNSLPPDALLRRS